METLRLFWQAMFTPPWRKIGAYRIGPGAYYQTGPFDHIISWLLGWFWSILGLVLGAFIATPILGHVGAVNTPYQDWATYGIALLSAFAVQIVCFGLFVLPAWVATETLDTTDPWLQNSAILIIALLSLIGESYALWRFIQTQNIQQGTVTLYVVGGFILKAIVLPVLKSLAVALIIKPILRWLRGEEGKA